MKLKVARGDGELLQKCKRDEGMVARDGEERMTQCHSHHVRAMGWTLLGFVYQKTVNICLERNVST